MSKGGENQALSNEESTLQNIQNIVNSWNQQYDQLGLPALQTLFPELMNTVQGKGSPLTTAAEAPVLAQTNAALRGAQQQASGLANPDLLYENIADTGSRNAGLASDQVVLGSLGDLANLIGGQQSMVESGAGLLPGVAGQYGQIAQQLDPWNAIASIVQAGAEAYGASQGAPTKTTTRQPTSAPTPSSVQLPSLSNILSGQPWSTMPNANANVSTPTSALRPSANTVASTGSGGLASMPFYGA